MSPQRVWLVSSWRRVGHCALAAFLASSWNLAGAHADSADVRVACPDLTGEQAAELEARAQATLLTSDVRAQAAILCHESGAEIQVEAGEQRIVLQARAAPGTGTLRDAVQRSLDQALYELRAGRAAVTPGDAEGSSASAPQPVSASPEPPARPPTPPAVPAPAPRPPLPSRAAPGSPPLVSEVSAGILAEMWSGQAAVGGGIRGALASRSGVEIGVRAGALHPLGLSGFDANEAHVVFEGTLEPSFARGLRLSLGIGASLLFVTPEPALSATGGTTRAALRAEVQLGRAFRWGWFQLLPSVGLRFFSEERGVRIDGRDELELAGFGPRLGLAFGYRN